MSITGAFVLPHPPLILPEIGKGQETIIQNTVDAYLECAAEIARLQPDTIILLSPHTTMYLDYFHISPGTDAEGNFSNYAAPQVKITANYDKELASAIEQRASSQGIPAGFLGERNPALDHGTMIPLYFVNQFYQKYQLVRIGLSGLSPSQHYRFGMCIAKTIEQLNRNVVLIASGDLSHKLQAEGPYGFTPEGVEFDQQLTEALATGNFLKLLQFPADFLEKAAECGLKSFQIMAGALNQKEVVSRLLSYEGPFGVGYSVASFLPLADNPDRNFLEQYLEWDEECRRLRLAQESPHVRLARRTIENYIKTAEEPMLPKDLPEHFYTEQAGVFVSLKKNGSLRGCIGTILPTTACIAEEILQNAISAATNDYRFDAVTAEELPLLEYSVDVLTTPESIGSADELDVKRYGVIVTAGHKRGLLLPDLAGVDTVEEQIRIARQKGGIGDDEPISLSRFEVVRYR